MEISMSKTDLKEIDYIIEHFVENNKNATTSISAIAFCLQTLIEGKEKLEKVLEGEEDD